jgi:hypothetical protein
MYSKLYVVTTDRVTLIIFHRNNHNQYIFKIIIEALKFLCPVSKEGKGKVLPRTVHEGPEGE